MAQPVIGLTLDSEKPGGYSKTHPWYALRINYCDAVAKAGVVGDDQREFAVRRVHAVFGGGHQRSQQGGGGNEGEDTHWEKGQGRGGSRRSPRSPPTRPLPVPWKRTVRFCWPVSESGGSG